MSRVPEGSPNDDVASLAQRVLAGDRAALARAITRVESRRAEHRVSAEQLLAALAPHAGRSVRVGISGLPGAGKSTFIDAFGSMLTARGHRVAVLAVDPSSSRTGGSILGDKTRMTQLAVDANAYVRPSPTGGTLGGVTRSTREAILVCEAAGFDVVLVETVGVGQSEIAVADMVDFFLVLMLAGGGDELQGIKKGVLELADCIAITKADGDNVLPAKQAAADYQRALRILTPHTAEWQPPVVTTSSVEGNGLAELWTLIEGYRNRRSASGAWARRRSEQRTRWMWALVEDELKRGVLEHAAVRALAPSLEQQVADGEIEPTAAASRVLEAARSARRGDIDPVAVVDAVLRERHTRKLLADAPLDVRTDRALIEQIVAAAGWAPFHLLAAPEHRREGEPLAAIMPWRVHLLDAGACRALRGYLLANGDGSTFPRLLAAAAALAMVTWLPDAPTVPLAPNELFAGTRENMEHVAAASAAVQNLLLAATARGVPTFWATGGPLRDAVTLERLGIGAGEVLLGAVFLSPPGFEAEEGREVKTSSLRDRRGPLSGWVRWVDN
ncbi:MAG: methylmalonyl Co-A mutase-associated GTPase MeaB [Gemmatimonadaceae bacterium]|nr:methylmalonyl Co-A mutase-associated GTPase MeaB [Gemmatimonadaceae bacterium]